MIKIMPHKKILLIHPPSNGGRLLFSFQCNAPRPFKFQTKAGDGVSFLGEFACVSEHKKDAPLPAVR